MLGETVDSGRAGGGEGGANRGRVAGPINIYELNGEAL